MCDDLRSNCFGSCDLSPSLDKGSHMSGVVTSSSCLWKWQREAPPGLPVWSVHFTKTNKTLGHPWLLLPEAAVALKRRVPLSVRGRKFSGRFSCFSSRSVVSHWLLPQRCCTHRPSLIDLWVFPHSHKCTQDKNVTVGCGRLGLHSPVNNKQPSCGERSFEKDELNRIVFPINLGRWPLFRRTLRQNTFVYKTIKSWQVRTFFWGRNIAKVLLEP